jgi:hypothetical protein
LKFLVFLGAAIATSIMKTTMMVPGSPTGINYRILYQICVHASFSDTDHFLGTHTIGYTTSVQKLSVLVISRF